VLAAWEAERATFVRAGVGGKKQLDLAASVALSLASPRMTEPARRLFAVLGRLPHGLAQADLGAVMPAAEGAEAARALRRTGLVLRDPARLRMLAPVREQAAAAPLGEAERERLVAHFAALADALPYLGEEPRDRVAALRAREELANVEAALTLAPLSTDPAGLSESGWRWVRVGDAHRVVGAVRPAADAYRAAHGLFERAVRAAPGHAEWQRDLSVSWNKLGDVRRAQGDLEGALAAYEQTHATLAKLAAADPGNAGWQRDLSVSWNRLGDARRTQGDLAGALEAYTAGKDIAERLAASDPGNAERQYDLGISHERLGAVLQAQGRLAEAAASYQGKHDIISKLVASDPGNADWQRDLSVSWIKLGGARQAQGDLAGALAAYTEGKAIRERLAAADPGNAQWQRDLSVSWERLASVREAQQDRAGALEAWRAALAISTRLADAAPDSVEIRTTLVVHLAGVARTLDPGDPATPAEAARLYDRALALLRPLAEAGKLDADRQGWIARIESERAAQAQD
jgi:tetratricopeptide (TPR) repeat protein